MDVVEGSVVERLLRDLLAGLPAVLGRLPVVELASPVHERVAGGLVEWPAPADPRDESLAAQ